MGVKQAPTPTGGISAALDSDFEGAPETATPLVGSENGIPIIPSRVRRFFLLPGAGWSSEDLPGLRATAAWPETTNGRRRRLKACISLRSPAQYFNNSSMLERKDQNRLQVQSSARVTTGTREPRYHWRATR